MRQEGYLTAAPATFKPAIQVFRCPSTLISVASTFLKITMTLRLGSANDVKLEAPVKAEYDEEEDECSTLPEGLAVRVRKDGQVVVIDAKSTPLAMLAHPLQGFYSHLYGQ